MGFDPARHRLLFVGGLHRSGTTLLADLIAAHPSTSGFANTGVPADEGQHLQDVYPAARAYGGPGRFGLAPDAHMTETHELVSPRQQDASPRSMGASLGSREDGSRREVAAEPDQDALPAGPLPGRDVRHRRSSPDPGHPGNSSLARDPAARSARRALAALPRALRGRRAAVSSAYRSFATRSSSTTPRHASSASGRSLGSSRPLSRHWWSRAATTLTSRDGAR